MNVIARCNESNTFVVRPIMLGVVSGVLAVLIAVVGISVAWGKLLSSNEAVARTLEKKVDKSVFDLYMQESKSQLQKIDFRQQRLEDKIDKVLETLSNQNTSLQERKTK